MDPFPAGLIIKISPVFRILSRVTLAVINSSLSRLFLAALSLMKA